MAYCKIGLEPIRALGSGAVLPSSMLAAATSGNSGVQEAVHVGREKLLLLSEPNDARRDTSLEYPIRSFGNDVDATTDSHMSTESTAGETESAPLHVHH